jgi:hypothetical protein
LMGIMLGMLAHHFSHYYNMEMLTDGVRATSHTRLKAYDHCNLRALIG